MKTAIIFVEICLCIIFFNIRPIIAAIDLNDYQSITCTADVPNDITFTGINFTNNVKIYLVPKDQSVEIGNLKTKDMVLDVVVRDNVAFIADTLGDFIIANIDDPSKPYMITSIKTPPMAVGITISDDNKKAYVSSYYGGVHTINITNLKHPILLSDPSFSPGRIIRTALINENTLCLASEQGMKILDVSNPLAYGVDDNTYGTNAQAISVIIKDGWAVLSLRNKGFDIINTNNLSQESVKMLTHAWGTLFWKDKLCVVNEKKKLHIYDFTSPENPEEIVSWTTQGSGIQLDAVDDMLCVATFDGIECIDISNIYSIIPVWDYKLPEPAFRIAMKDNIAYLACYSKGIVNIALPVIIKPEIIDIQTIHMTIPAIRFPGEYTLRIIDQNVQKELDVKFLKQKTLKASKESFYFGIIKAGEASEPFSFTIFNESPKTIDIHSLSITGTYKSSYNIITDNCSNTQLNSQARCRIEICYQPLFDALHPVQMTIPFIEPYRSLLDSITVKLSGESYLDEKYQFETMVPQGMSYSFYDISGMTCDYEGNIYIAETKRNRILKYNSQGILLYMWGGFGVDDGKFNHPMDIKFDGDQYLYVADSSNHRIQRFTLNGLFDKKWGKMGYGDGEFLFPQSIAIEKDAYNKVAYIYVANRLNDVQKFDKNMNFEKKWRPSEKELSGIAIYEQHDEKFVYVVDSERIVFQYDSEGNLIRSWDSSSGIENLHYNGGIAVDPDGIIYVMDGIIQTFKPDGSKITDWGLPFSDQSNCFELPMGMAFDWPNEKRIYVSDWDQDTLYLLDTEGNLKSKWSIYGDKPRQFNEARSIAAYNGKLFVADQKNNRLQIFDISSSKFEFVETWEKYKDQGEEILFNLPEVVATDDQGHIFVANDGCRQLLIFNNDKKLYKSFDDIKGYDPAEKISFSAIAPANNEKQLFYVFENIKRCLLAINMEGELISSFGKQGTFEGEFSQCNGICIEKFGTYDYIYLLERENSRIQKIRYDYSTKVFTFVKMWGKSGADIGEFYNPRSIAIDSSGILYASDRNDRIQLFDTEGNVITLFGEHGAGPGQFDDILGIVINSDKKIYVADSYNRIQRFAKTIFIGGKAIIVSGGGPYEDNNIWEETFSNTMRAYNILTMQGFTKANIHYETFDLDLDIDNNGFADDVDAKPTKDNLKNAITKWAIDKTHLTIYLTNHGGHEFFLVEGNEGFSKQKKTDNAECCLTVGELNEWLQRYEDTSGGQVTLVYDACYSGSFIEQLQSKNRLIITSTNVDETATMAVSGTISFSYYFWTYVNQGMNIGDAFEKAKEVMTYHRQEACMPVEPDNLTLTTQHIGNGTTINTSAPIIQINEHNVSISNTSATISGIRVNDPDGVASVWAVVKPPNYGNQNFFDTIKDLPRIIFKVVKEDDNDLTYEGTYDKFTISGQYTILIYASDVYNNFSTPEPINIAFNDQTSSRKAIIVTGSSIDDEQPEIITQNISAAIDCLLFQEYAEKDIFLLSKNVTLNLPKQPTEIKWYEPSLDNLKTCITGIANNLTYDLVLYLVGDGTHERFLINAIESLTPSDLKQWLDTLQQNISNPVIVLYDACRAKSFTEQLIPNNDLHRVLIASTGSNQPAYFQSESGICFSAYFWDEIKKGKCVSDAFNMAYQRNQMDKQVPEIYDPHKDAQTTFIGFGYKTADQFFSSESLNITLNETDSSALISVNVDLPIDEIQSVFAVINKRDSPRMQMDVYCDVFLNTTNNVVYLENQHDNIFSGFSGHFLSYGYYLISVYYRDNKGNIKTVIKDQPLYKKYGEDIYEQDDEPEDAKVIRVNETGIENTSLYQKRSFHYKDDVDWMKFYAVKNQDYYIHIMRPDNYVGLNDYDYANLFLDRNNSHKFGKNGESYFWTCEKSGTAFIKVDFPNPNLFHQTEPYDIRIYTIENDDIIKKELSGNIFDNHSGELISNAVIISDIGFTAISETDQNPNYYFYLSEFSQSFQITVTVNGYLPFNDYVIMDSYKKVKNIGLISTQQVLIEVISILQALSGQSSPYSTTLDYNHDEKLSMEDAFFLLNHLIN